MPFLGVLLLQTMFIYGSSRRRVWPWWCLFILMREAIGGATAETVRSLYIGWLWCTGFCQLLCVEVDDVRLASLLYRWGWLGVLRASKDVSAASAVRVCESATVWCAMADESRFSGVPCIIPVLYCSFDFFVNVPSFPVIRGIVDRNGNAGMRGCVVLTLYSWLACCCRAKRGLVVSPWLPAPDSVYRGVVFAPGVHVLGGVRQAPPVSLIGSGGTAVCLLSFLYLIGACMRREKHAGFKRNCHWTLFGGDCMQLAHCLPPESRLASFLSDTSSGFGGANEMVLLRVG